MVVEEDFEGEVVHGGADYGMPPWAAGAPLPAFTHIDGRNVVLADAGEYRALLALMEAVGRPATAVSGVEVVTIPLAHYAELMDGQRRLAVAEVSPARLVANPRSRVDYDPPVATFLAECLGRRLLKDTYTLCRERFGEDRTPSKSTIQRYWARLGRQS